jgi:hypothetical protein
MENLSIVNNIQERIVEKLEAGKALSFETAITAKEANLDDEESSWLNYVAGGLFSKVKKTKDKRYYTTN